MAEFDPFYTPSYEDLLRRSGAAAPPPISTHGYGGATISPYDDDNDVRIVIDTNNNNNNTSTSTTDSVDEDDDEEGIDEEIVSMNADDEAARNVVRVHGAGFEQPGLLERIAIFFTGGERSEVDSLTAQEAYIDTPLDDHEQLALLAAEVDDIVPFTATEGADDVDHSEADEETDEEACVALESGAFVGVRILHGGDGDDAQWDEEDALVLDAQAHVTLLQRREQQADVDEEQRNAETMEGGGGDARQSSADVHVQTTGVVYARHDGHLCHFVRCARTRKTNHATACNADGVSGRVAYNSILFNIEPIVRKRDGDYERISEDYYWAYKQAQWNTANALEMMRASLKALTEKHVELAATNIEDAIAQLEILFLQHDESPQQQQQQQQQQQRHASSASTPADQ